MSWRVRRLLPGDGMVHEAPSDQAAIDLVRDWIGLFPSETGLRTNGHIELFADQRARWGLEQLGSLAGKRVLELGPLEGSHTFLLDRSGAHVTAIEANKRSYLKCLIAKEVLGLTNSRFLLGNFLPFLETGGDLFDLVWASGVLYHMTEPLRLLKAIAARTDRVFLWTHYFPDDGNPRRPPFFRKRIVHFAGRDIPHFDRVYLRPRWRPLACGGVAPGSSWLKREDITFALKALGFSRISAAHEDRTTPYRHSIAIVATKDRR